MVPDVDGQQIRDSMFYFHESWASMALHEEPLSEVRLVALFDEVKTRYRLDKVRLFVEDCGPDNGDDGFAWFVPEDQSIHIKRGYEKPSHLLHEFAHVLTQEQEPNWHGQVMLDRYLDLILEFIGEEAHNVFARQFRDFRESHLT